jgi:alpha-beta hydrolase superfamily lysophospholipase
MGLIAEHDGALDGYEAVQLPPAPAESGCRGAAMLRRRSARISKRAVLYLHCLADSFVPEDLASWYTERGFHFYVADLRPQARLDRPAGGRRGPPDLRDCFSALDAMSAYLRDTEAIDTVVVSAHAAGALIAALWCDARRDSRPADALILAGPAFGSGRRKGMFKRLRKADQPSQASGTDAVREASSAGKTRSGAGPGSTGEASRASAAGTASPAAASTAGPGTAASNAGTGTAATNAGAGIAVAADAAGLAESGRLPGLLAGAQRQLRGGLDIACPVLVMCTAADWDAPESGRRRKGPKHLGGGPGTTRLGPHVTWLRLAEGLTGPLPPGGPESRPFFRELGRWLGAYLSGQFRDQLL